MAALWIAAQISPGATALVGLSEIVTALVCGLFAGVYADRLHKVKAMMMSDLVRAIAVFTLPIAAHFGTITIPHLMFVGIVLGGFNTLFDPCLGAAVPALADDPESLHATNALMDATRRVARTIGPGCAGLLAVCIPISQFFTIDAISFLISAAGVAYLGHKHAERFIEVNRVDVAVSGIVNELRESIEAAGKNKIIARDFTTYAFISFAYSIAYTVGLPFITKQKFGDAIGAYGMLVAAYGVGSLAGNLLLGNMRARKAANVMFAGYMTWGLGFVVLGLAPNLPIALLAAAIGSIGSPLVAITMQTTIQGEIPTGQIGKVLALRLTIGYLGLGLGLALAAPLYEHFSAAAVITGSAVLFVLVVLLNKFAYQASSKPSSSS